MWQLAKKYDRFDNHINALNYLVSKLEEVATSGSPANGFKYFLFILIIYNQLRTHISCIFIENIRPYG